MLCLIGYAYRQLKLIFKKKSESAIQYIDEKLPYDLTNIIIHYSFNKIAMSCCRVLTPSFSNPS